ncbi:MAG: tRNA (adenosine(37)-N6)-dimethylallyltransferase MiaA [Alphaproteobacteria bacterium]|nr:MAG: tRNA (adenosine(37)-N6)-dimethylallyltransferase MiaA [Alphaproteobacteria bacterium]
MNQFICISGCTASGKSSFALELSKYFKNPMIINTDALQVYNCWEILTDRPSVKKPYHTLYGHVSCASNYSVGDWVKDVSKIFGLNSKKSQTFIFVGGTGLYFNALLNGLSQIPQIPKEIREFANAQDLTFFLEYLEKNDPDVLEKIDVKNQRRVQRAWEVLKATNKSILYWQSNNASPLVSSDATLLLVEIERESLTKRISARVDFMLESGAIKEVEKVYKTCWDVNLPFSKAIGAQDIISYLNSGISLDKLTQNISLKTRQFAKRQRTWHRNYMKNWISIDPSKISGSSIQEIVKKVKGSN